jgi:hypothetical protein
VELQAEHSYPPISSVASATRRRQPAQQVVWPGAEDTWPLESSRASWIPPVSLFVQVQTQMPAMDSAAHPGRVRNSPGILASKERNILVLFWALDGPSSGDGTEGWNLVAKKLRWDLKHVSFTYFPPILRSNSNLMTDVCRSPHTCLQRLYITHPPLTLLGRLTQHPCILRACLFSFEASAPAQLFVDQLLVHRLTRKFASSKVIY